MIAIDEAAGLSGLLLPGDRVDIILTYALSGEQTETGRGARQRGGDDQPAGPRVDRRLAAGPQAADVPGAVPPIARTATLEVTLREAEVLTLATSLGDLSLALNSVRDGGEPAETRPPGAILAPVGLRPRLAGSADAVRHPTLDAEMTSLLMPAPPAPAAPVAEPARSWRRRRPHRYWLTSRASRWSAAGGISRCWNLKRGPRGRAERWRWCASDGRRHRRCRRT